MNKKMMKGRWKGKRGRALHKKVEVFEANLEESFEQIRRMIPQYNHVAVDTEYPGIMWDTYAGDQLTKYSCIKKNVDYLKIIQLGFTLMNEKGELAQPICTWEFNFQFDLGTDACSERSIEFLKRGGIPFAKMRKEGVNPAHFAELLITSGIICSPNNYFICFQGQYDFFYLLKVLLNHPLPESRDSVCLYLDDYFNGKIIDIKYLTMVSNGQIPVVNRGLDHLALQLNVRRCGRAHCAGSDSRLTGEVFFKLIKDYPQAAECAQRVLGKVAGFDSIIRVDNDKDHGRFF